MNARDETYKETNFRNISPKYNEFATGKGLPSDCELTCFNFS